MNRCSRGEAKKDQTNSDQMALCSTELLDLGYSGKNFAENVKKVCGEKVRVEVIKRNSKDFEILPKRWIVERTFGWLNRFRRLSKDYELFTQFSTAMIYGSLIRLMTRRLAS